MLRLENAVCTPHIGYVEQDSYELYFKAAFENVVNFINGTPTNILNPEALRVLALMAAPADAHGPEICARARARPLPTHPVGAALAVAAVAARTVLRLQSARAAGLRRRAAGRATRIGGAAALALASEEFVEMLAISQVLPGPNVVNLALMFGDRAFGVRGALAALSGMLLAPLVLVLVLAALYGHYAEYTVVTGALRGMGAVAAGLVLSTAMKLVGTLRRNAMGPVACIAFGALTVIATAWLRLPLIWVLLVLGLAGVGIAWRMLKGVR